jgi:hypothetical protein
MSAQKFFPYMINGEIGHKRSECEEIDPFVVLDAERSRVMSVIEARSEPSGLAPALASMSEDFRTEVHYNWCKADKFSPDNPITQKSHPLLYDVRPLVPSSISQEKSWCGQLLNLWKSGPRN